MDRPGSDDCASKSMRFVFSSHEANPVADKGFVF
jgi:hypothetical protein